MHQPYLEQRGVVNICHDDAKFFQRNLSLEQDTQSSSNIFYNKICLSMTKRHCLERSRRTWWHHEVLPVIKANRYQDTERDTTSWWAPPLYREAQARVSRTNALVWGEHTVHPRERYHIISLHQESSHNCSFGARRYWTRYWRCDNMLSNETYYLAKGGTTAWPLNFWYAA